MQTLDEYLHSGHGYSETVVIDDEGKDKEIVVLKARLYDLLEN